ncbi:E3 ubiquitin-protein ligase HECW2 [Mytilus galloprovincialis]|uniref:HECT-type E3 ubiquitin transferase n=1 Tax=Mytilus galloprovincialis TaxID=29158 RepID=A0A8B6DQ18_MYTGA|nr:E3 ubiquitin-protein ligase HECW2 [Mytilus galloprovincialis]
MLRCDPYLLFLGETDKSQFWDSKGRGGNGGQTGELLWDLHDVMYKFTEDKTKVCFKYYIGNTSQIVATSPSVTVINSKTGKKYTNEEYTHALVDYKKNLVRIILSDLEACNLKKGMFFNPDPYVKMTLIPSKVYSPQVHHYQERRTSIASNTTNPHWKNQTFTLDTLPADVIEFEIKDKFAKSRPTISRFLGKASLPVQKVLNKSVPGAGEFDLDLTRRNPSDSVSGSLRFMAEAEVYDGEHFTFPAVRQKAPNKRQVSLPEESFSFKKSPQIQRHNTDPESVTNGNCDTNIDNDQEDSGISLPHERIPDDVDIELAENEAEILSCSPPNLASVPSIVCGYNSHIDSQSLRSDEISTAPNSDNSGGMEIGSSLGNSEALNGLTLIHAFDSSSGNSSAERIETSESVLDRDDIMSTASSCDVEVQLTLMGVEGGTDETVPGPPPTLPPRTYKAPPLPPRSRNSDAPPLPPRTPERTLEKPTFPKSSVSPVGISDGHSLELPPPPLPPRTYSPISLTSNSDELSLPALAEAAVEEETKDSFDSTEAFLGSNDSCGSEGAVGGPVKVKNESPHNIIRTKHGSLKGGGSTHKVEIARASTIDNSNCDLVVKQKTRKTHSDPTKNDTSSTSDINLSDSSRNLFAQLSSLPSIDSVVSVSQCKRNSHSVECSPRSSPVSVITSYSDSVTDKTRHKHKHSDRTYKQSDSVHATPIRPACDRSSVSASPPRIVPRTRMLSEEEKQQNRQHIVQQLQQWTEKQKHKSKAESNSGQDSSFSGCENSSVSNETLENVSGMSSLDSVSPSLHDQTDSQSATASPVNGTSEDTQSNSVVWQLRQPQSQPQASTSAQIPEPQSPLPKLPARKKFQKVDPTHGDDPLPPDHINRTTTWQKPSSGQNTIQRRPTISSEQRQQLDRRYQSIRRTINQRPEPEPPSAENTSSGGSDGSPQTSAQARVPPPPTMPVPPIPTPVVPEPDDARPPAIKFLLRTDFFPLLQQNDRAMAEYNRNGTLKHMIHKTRRDSKNFYRYQHNRDLVAFINLFSDSSKEMPPNWEMKFDRGGKMFFIDHNKRLTTFLDPRLPTDVPPINTDFLHSNLFTGRNRGVRVVDDSPRNHSSGSSQARPPLQEPDVPTTYNEKVVSFLRQPNASDILKEKYPTYASTSKLRDKVNKIQSGGTEALERMCNDLDLILLLSVFENDIMSYIPSQLLQPPRPDSPVEASQGSPNIQRVRVHAPQKRDFQAKLRKFYKQLETKGYGQGPSKLKLMVRRDHVLEDAFNKIMSTPKKDLMKSKLYITFVGEEGLDYENHHEWFRFAGRVLGLAVVHQYLLDAFFTRPFYKALLRIQWSLGDVETLDAEFHQSLLWIKENDITELDMDLTFSVNEEVFGQVTERELKPNGKTLAVTERNKKEYIEKMVKWRLERGVTEQTESVVRGFNEVLDSRMVAMYDARELELVIAGTVEIDVKDWRRNTEYRSGYHDQHPVIQWFWQAIEKFDNERRLRLLQFVTGTSSIPYEGFSALRGSNGPRKFCIEKWGRTTSLPRAHTCFNRVDLPPYTSFDMLYEKLVTAVEETSTFGIE